MKRAWIIVFLIAIVLSACSTETFDACDFNENGEVEAFEEKRCAHEKGEDIPETVEEDSQKDVPVVEKDEETTPPSSGINTHMDEAFPPIYVSIFSHNEEANRGGYPDFVEDEDAFWEQREGIVNFANMLYEEGVMYNYQSDWTFLLAARLYDRGTESTNNKNVVRYLKEDLGFEIDPHAHESKYNYADVAYLIDQLGVEPSHTVGGAVAYPPEDSKIEYLWETIEGWKYSYSWKAKVIMGTGVAGHQNEEEFWISGIWKAKDDENTLVHDEDAPLPVIGSYGRRGDYLGEDLDELLAFQKNGDLVPGKIYTASFSVRQDWFTDESIKEFREMIKGYEDETAEGRIIWVGFDEVYTIWADEYNAEANQLKYTDFHDTATSNTAPEASNDCGDGSCNSFEKKLGSCPEDCE